MKKVYTFLFIIFFGLVQGCSSFSEVEVKRYEDYFPSKSSSTYSQTSSTENYEVYTSDEYADEQKQVASANVPLPMVSNACLASASVSAVTALYAP